MPSCFHSDKMRSMHRRDLSEDKAQRPRITDACSPRSKGSWHKGRLQDHETITCQHDKGPKGRISGQLHRAQTQAAAKPLLCWAAGRMTGLPGLTKAVCVLSEVPANYQLLWKDNLSSLQSPKASRLSSSEWKVALAR